jgi:hypothetical protein
MNVLALALLLAAAEATQPAPAPQTPAAAPPAPAPDASSTTVGGVTVEAPSKKADQTFRAHVDQFVHSEARPGIGPIKQITEWNESVCPETLGLTPALNAFVTQRIKAVAKKVGAPQAPGCIDWAPNVQVVFTTEPQKVVDDMRLHHPALLGYHYKDQTRAFATFEPPIKSWYVSDTLVFGLFRNQPPQKVHDVAGPHGFCAGLGECRMPPKLESRFTHAVVVIDAGRTEGKAIGAVADEIAMIVLSRQAPREGCSPLPSVMDALDASCPGSDALEGLTPYDEAFLKALYARHDTEFLPVERSEIEAAVRAVGRAAMNEVSEPDPPAAPSGP